MPNSDRFLVVLKNGFSFTTSAFRENINDVFFATLLFESPTPNEGMFNVFTLKDNFTEENLSLIKIFKNSAETDVPIATYSTYKYLSGFNTIVNQSGTTCTLTLQSTAKSLNSAITG